MELTDILHERAVAASGLDDFGADDYREGLERLVSAVTAIPGPDRDAVEGLAAALVLPPLVGRLHSERGWSEFPRCRDQVLLPPLLVTGMPRTGTTALHKLLSVDPQFQVIESWLISAPKPRPPRDAWADDPAFRAACARADAIPDGLRAAHFTEPHEADECLALMAQSFVSNQWGSSHGLPEYDAWVFTQDMTPSFGRYADNLRLIGAEELDRRWLLKNPSNALTIRPFLEMFPDAMVVQTHRDPFVAMGSLVDLLAGISGPGSADDAAIVARELPLWADAMREMLSARADGSGTFVDIDYRAFVADPVGTTRTVYAGFGLELTASTETAMRSWLSDNPADKHGVRTYSPADRGVTVDLIEEHFGSYCDHFDLRGRER